jgi:hypothetical protein
MSSPAPAPSPAVAASPAGASAILAALASSALAAAISLFFSELLRISSAELRERVFAPRVTRRLMKRREQARALAACTCAQNPASRAQTLSAAQRAQQRADARASPLHAHRRPAQRDALAAREAVPSLPSRAPFSWLAPLLRVSDEALLPEVGLDAVFYIKFTRLVRSRSAQREATFSRVAFSRFAF